jgi:hypothetical protein
MNSHFSGPDKISKFKLSPNTNVKLYRQLVHLYIPNSRKFSRLEPISIYTTHLVSKTVFIL